MADLGWLTQALTDVPEDDRWLSDREREVLSKLRAPKRRSDWRLGRWTAKRALASWPATAALEVEVLAADDGAPEAFAAGSRLGLEISLSHRAGRALAIVGEDAGGLGCDLEVVEARTPAFMRQWLRADERELVAGAAPELRNLFANLLWAAKEAATKVRREGLRLDVREARVELDSVGESPHGWRRLRVGWGDRPAAPGWWRWEQSWVMAAIAERPAELPPRDLAS